MKSAFTHWANLEAARDEHPAEVRITRWSQIGSYEQGLASQTIGLSHNKVNNEWNLWNRTFTRHRKTVL